MGLFVEQVTSADPACQDVVGRYLSQRTALKLKANGLATGSYCKARHRLPLALIEACAMEVADFVIREHGARKSDATYSDVLGANDRRLVWARPACPGWMEEDTYAAMPEALCVREVRDGERRIVTSLRDPGQRAGAGSRLAV